MKSKLGSLKNQIVDNIYQYYDSKQPAEDAGPTTNNYFDMSSVDENDDRGVNGSLEDGDPDAAQGKTQGEKEAEGVEESGQLEKSNGSHQTRSKREMSVKEKHEQKISDISFPFENQEDFIQFGDNPDSEGSAEIDAKNQKNDPDNKIDFNLTGNLEQESQPSMSVHPREEYGGLQGNHRFIFIY